MGATSIKEKVTNYIKTDDEKKLNNYINLLKPNKYINKSKTFTYLNISASYGSIKCVKVFINHGWDVNCPELKNGNSSLLLSCKFGYIDLVKILLKKHNADIKFMNYQKLNCLDMAIIYDKFSIAEILISDFGMKIQKSGDEYKKIIQENNIFFDEFDTKFDRLIKIKPGDPNYKKEMSDETFQINEEELETENNKNFNDDKEKIYIFNIKEKNK